MLFGVRMTSLSAYSGAGSRRAGFRSKAALQSLQKRALPGGGTIGRALVKPRPSRYNQKREAGTMAAPMASEPTAPTVGGAAELGK